MSKLKHFTTCVLAVLVLLSGSLTAAAATGNVTYSGDAGEFVFQPGSDQSVTDLFPEFKDVMPGDTLTQTILVRNDASDKVSVKIYLRALGAHEDSQDFLSQLSLSVAAGETQLFKAPADEKAQLTDWVELGTFSGSGEVMLDVALHVPVSLDNRYMDQVGYLDWQFMVEELEATKPDQPDQPDEPDVPDQPDKPDEPGGPDQPQKPDVPKTGDPVRIGLFLGLFVGSGALILLVLWLLLKKKKQEQ